MSSDLIQKGKTSNPNSLESKWWEEASQIFPKKFLSKTPWPANPGWKEIWEILQKNRNKSFWWWERSRKSWGEMALVRWVGNRVGGGGETTSNTPIVSEPRQKKTPNKFQLQVSTTRPHLAFLLWSFQSLILKRDARSYSQVYLLFLKHLTTSALNKCFFGDFFFTGTPRTSFGPKY